MKKSILLSLAAQFLPALYCGCAAVPWTVSKIENTKDFVLEKNEALASGLRARNREASEEIRDAQYDNARSQAWVEEDRRARRESLRTTREDARDLHRSQYRESLRTTLGLDIDQRLKFGQLQVDEAKLSQLLSKRKKEREALKKVFDELNKRIEVENREALLKQAREALERGDHETCRKELKKCCLLRWCRRDSEPLLPEPLILREPLSAPIMPTEIPLNLPVTLSVDVRNPQLDRSVIRRQPIVREPHCPTCEKDPCECISTKECTTTSPEQKPYEPPDAQRSASRLQQLKDRIFRE